ncbi:MAG: gas vesicle protein GvpFL [Streptosporangiales bacterium]|nr:gas vesicle protein GvpFL [Streptosporangiales bacterium]
MTEHPRVSYAYAVTRGLDPADVPAVGGVAGTGVHRVAEDDLAVVVSTVPEGDFDEAALRSRLNSMDSLERLARAHHEVIDAVAVRSVVLPLRLATVYRNDDRVRSLLREERERFGAALDRVDGHAEWGVKVYADPDATPSPGVRVSGGPTGSAGAGGGAAGSGSGRDYLRRRREERHSRDEIWRNAAELAARADAELAALADEVRVHRPQNRQLSGAPGENVLNAAYLVPVERTTDFTAVARGLAGSLPGTRLELTGPWAPYSFTVPARAAETLEAGR